MKNFKKNQRGGSHPFGHNLGRFFGEKRSFDHLSLINLENFIFDKNGNSLEKLTNIVYGKEIESLKMSYLFDFIVIQTQMIRFPKKNDARPKKVGIVRKISLAL